MQIVRTIVWVVLLVAFVSLAILNWDVTLAMRIWPGLVWDTRLPAVITLSFLLGLLPMWLLHRTTKWRMTRRVNALEAATTKMSTPAPTPAPAAPTAPPRSDRPAESENPVDPEPTNPA